MQTIENNYEISALVFGNDQPLRPLVIRRYLDRMYYCLDKDDPEGADLVYFECELSAVLAHNLTVCI